MYTDHVPWSIFKKPNKKNEFTKIRVRKNELPYVVPSVSLSHLSHYSYLFLSYLTHFSLCLSLSLLTSLSHSHLFFSHLSHFYLIHTHTSLTYISHIFSLVFLSHISCTVFLSLSLTTSLTLFLFLSLSLSHTHISLTFLSHISLSLYISVSHTHLAHLSLYNTYTQINPPHAHISLPLSLSLTSLSHIILSITSLIFLPLSLSLSYFTLTSLTFLSLSLTSLTFICHSLSLSLSLSLRTGDSSTLGGQLFTDLAHNCLRTLSTLPSLFFDTSSSEGEPPSDHGGSIRSAHLSGRTANLDLERLINSKRSQFARTVIMPNDYGAYCMWLSWWVRL